MQCTISTLLQDVLKASFLYFQKLESVNSWSCTCEILALTRREEPMIQTVLYISVKTIICLMVEVKKSQSTVDFIEIKCTYIKKKNVHQNK